MTASHLLSGVSDKERLNIRSLLLDLFLDCNDLKKEIERKASNGEDLSIIRERGNALGLSI